MPQHTYHRPGWLCTVDGEPWPCAAKRAEYRARLHDEFDPRAEMRVRTVLGAHALDAQHDLGLTDEDAYVRFVAWSYGGQIVIAAPEGAEISGAG